MFDLTSSRFVSSLPLLPQSFDADLECAQASLWTPVSVAGYQLEGEGRDAGIDAEIMAKL